MLEYLGSRKIRQWLIEVHGIQKVKKAHKRVLEGV
jgi:hypothetical protein